MINLVNNYLLSFSLHILTMNQYRTLMHMVMATNDGAEEEAILYLQDHTGKTTRNYYINNPAGDNCLWFHLQINNLHFTTSNNKLTYIQAHDVCEFLRLNSKEALKGY